MKPAHAALYLTLWLTLGACTQTLVCGSGNRLSDTAPDITSRAPTPASETTAPTPSTRNH